MGQREDGDSSDSGSESMREALLLVSCVCCKDLHRATRPLDFHPMCSTCAANRATMKSLEMSGFYPLSDQTIDETLTRTSPGNYALGYMDGNTFRVFYVGRSDSDVRHRLHEWVGMSSRYENYASPAKAPWGVRRVGPLPVDAAALRCVGSGESHYTRFAYSYARSAEEAYAKEWRNYDAFGGSHGLDNETPPTSTATSRAEP